MMNLLIIVGVFITPYTQAILNSDPARIGALKNSVQFMFWNSKDYKSKLGHCHPIEKTVFIQTLSIVLMIRNFGFMENNSYLEDLPSYTSYL